MSILKEIIIYAYPDFKSSKYETHEISRNYHLYLHLKIFGLKIKFLLLTLDVN